MRLMRILPLLLSLAICLMISAPQYAISASDGPRSVDVSLGGEVTVRGQLRAVETSTVSTNYVTTISPGQRLEVEARVWHVEYVGSRVTVSMKTEDGGILVSASEIVSTGETRTFVLSYVFAKEYRGERVLVEVGTVADRFAPSVLNYSIKLSKGEVYDAKEVSYYQSGSSVPQVIRLNVGDMPYSIAQSIEIARGLPVLKPGDRLQTSGFLSFEQRSQGAGVIRVLRGNDIEDLYAFRVELSQGSGLTFTARPGGDGVITASILYEDGFTIKSASSKTPGQPVELNINFTKATSTVLLMRVSVLSSSVDLIPYTITIAVKEPQKVEKVTESEDLVIPEPIARFVIIGVAVAVVTAGIFSAVVGRRRSREW
ncbi:MAG: hypothetical protein NZ920_01780 [Aigarchaeota archaeon]|nr:hypothetical protein [Aigarchaeota archaeon]MDW8093173.1 hypothetical protein [Nitrososphaerota archaeon]